MNYIPPTEDQEIEESLDLNQMMNELLELRAKRDKSKAILSERKKAFEKENVTIKLIIKSESRHVESSESDIKGEALSRFKEDGYKNQCGVKIVEKFKLEYDRIKALEWAQKEARIYIIPESLDVKEFDKYARKHELDFVTLTPAPQAQIPSKIEVRG